MLANEQVVEGCCWRHEDTPVEQRALEQWFLKITAYADELLDAMDGLEGGWPERVLTMQRNWIGRSEGAEIDFKLAGTSQPIRVFTTRVDTIYGATCVIVAPEHPLNEQILDDAGRAHAKAMVDARANRDPGDIEKEGFFTGHYAVNPFNGDQVPIWVANFVLMGYGTGAIMAVPAHDERDFDICRQYGHRGAACDPSGGGHVSRRTGDERTLHGVRHRGKYRPVVGTRQRRGAPPDGCLCATIRPSATRR